MKLLVIMLLATLVILMQSCSIDTPKKERNEDDSNNSSSYIVEEVAEATEATEATEANGSKLYLDLLIRGNINDSYFDLGTDTKEIINKLGNPIEMDYFEGGLYFYYDNIMYYTDAALEEDGQLSHGKIVGIQLSVDEEIYGVKIGMTFKEIIEILGEPDRKSSLDDEFASYFYGGEWMIEYDGGTNSLIFVSNEELGKTHSASIWR